MKIGFMGLLTIVFITLKLTGHIAWSWWLVLSPIWVTSSIVLLIAISLLIIAVYKEYKEKVKG